MTSLTRILMKPRTAKGRQLTPIVPPANVSGHALIAVIAIMTFLSCLTLGAVTLVARYSRDMAKPDRPRSDHPDPPFRSDRHGCSADRGAADCRGFSRRAQRQDR